MSDGVLLVLTNYMRPQNLPKCIQAWKDQTIEPKTVVVVDNSPAPGSNLSEEYPNAWLDGVDDVWRFRQNLGPSCRFAPALLLTGHKYILFADDDLLPGKRALAYLLETAGLLQNRFSTLGARGRLLESSEKSDESPLANITRERGSPSPCDLTIRAHLAMADYVPYLLEYRKALIAKYGEEAERLSPLHDDFLLCIGIQRTLKYPSYVTAREADSEQELIMQDVEQESAHAMHNRPGFRAERHRMIEMAVGIGWKRPW